MKLSLTRIVALAVAFTALNIPTVPAEEKTTELGEQMEMISKTFRSLRRNARDPAKNAESADLVANMLKGAKAGLEHKPAWTSAQPADKQEAFVADFQKEMKVFVGLLTDLEKAFRTNDNDAANALIEKLRDQQKSSHDQFQNPDDH